MKLNYPLPSAVIQANIALLTKREEVGLAKYGHTLDRTDLGVEDLAQHFLEEMLDGANYAQAMLREMRQQRQEEASLRHRLATLLSHWKAAYNTPRDYTPSQRELLSCVLQDLQDLLEHQAVVELRKDLT